MKRLPETEFEIMKIVWTSVPLVTTSMIMREIGDEKGWKIQTVVSLMQNLMIGLLFENNSIVYCVC